MISFLDRFLSNQINMNSSDTDSITFVHRFLNDFFHTFLNNLIFSFPSKTTYINRL